MTPSELKHALHSGRTVLGTLLVSPSPKWPAALAGCGLDFDFIDTEHIALNRESLSWMCRTCAAMGLPPLVRIPTRDPDDATVALDDGAAGVIVPYVESVETVRAMVGATKMRPLKGQRLLDTLAGQPLEPSLAEYIAKRNEDHLLVVNIESVPAIAALDELLAVEGLDSVLIGPHDLSTSLGVPEQYDHPRFLEACETILGKARAAGIGAGIHHWLPTEKQVRFIGMGANLLIHKADMTIFQTGLQRELAEIRNLLENSAIESEARIDSI
jgi:4-hydroxy-2-oxoheptanedioate aldolase